MGSKLQKLKESKLEINRTLANRRYL